VGTRLCCSRSCDSQPAGWPALGTVLGAADTAGSDPPCARLREAVEVGS
jgi:hypothetical protein